MNDSHLAAVTQARTELGLWALRPVRCAFWRGALLSEGLTAAILRSIDTPRWLVDMEWVADF